MTFTQAVFLAIIQGLTEFLPVSSSGHLVLLQLIFGFDESPVFFDVLLHMGTLLAVIVFFRNRLLELARLTAQALIKGQASQVPKLVWLIALASLPAALTGLILNNLINQIFTSTSLLSAAFLLTTLFLFSTRLLKQNPDQSPDLNGFKALLIGVFQALAILPGVSRSGTTIVSGEWSGLKVDQAFEFSFLLSIPAILGALILQLPKMSVLTQPELAVYLTGAIIAAAVGFLSLNLLRRIVINHRLYLFGFYTLALSLVTFFWDDFAGWFN